MFLSSNLKKLLHTGSAKNPARVYERCRIDSLLQNMLITSVFHTSAKKSEKYITGPKGRIAVL